MAQSAQGEKRTDRRGIRWWWREPYAKHVCPITLEPLRKLLKPPFSLPADASAPPQFAARDGNGWFDAHMLACYFVSSSHFAHPVSRRPISREECTLLDEHLVANGLGEHGVAQAFDERDAPAAGRLARLRREAEQVMRTLFIAVSDASGSMGASHRARRGPPAVSASTAVTTDGGLTIVDDDARPSHATNTSYEPEPVATTPFPPLPAAQARPAPQRPSPLRVVAERMPKEQPVAMGVPPDAERARRTLLADAFGRDARGGSSFAASAATRFSPRALALARARPELIAVMEAALDQLLQPGSAQRAALPPMPKAQRDVACELARTYSVATIERDAEPRRHVLLLRTDHSEWPGVRLSDAAVGRGQAPAVRLSQRAPAAKSGTTRCEEVREESDGVDDTTAAQPEETDDVAEPVGTPADGDAASDRSLAPWRGRSALLRQLAADDARLALSPGAEAAALRATAMGGHTHRTRLLRMDAHGSGALAQPLTWDALRRLIWSAASEASAIERMQARGLSDGACATALAVAGGVDEHTRLAACSEWLLQQCERLCCEREKLQCAPVDAANPWGLDGSWQEGALAPIPESSGENSAGDGAVAHSAPLEAAAADSAVAVAAFELASALLPRDFLERQHRRWRKDQARRGVRDLAMLAQQLAAAERERPGATLSAAAPTA